MERMTGFMFQDEYLEMCAALTTEELGTLLQALSRYHATGEMPELKGAASVAFNFIRADIDRIEKNFAEKSETNRSNRKGKKRVRKNETERNVTNDNESERNVTNDNETVTNDNETERNVTNDNETPQVKEKEKVKEKVKVNSEERVSRDTRKNDEGFARFWSAYPRKQDKVKARKAFNELKPDDTLLDTMLSAIERQKQSPQWTRDGGQFIPLAATWLHGQRWEDEGIECGKPERESGSFPRQDYTFLEEFVNAV